MKAKNIALKVAASIFGIITVLFLLRIIFGVSVVIGGWALPMQVSIFALIGAFLLTVWFFMQSSSKEK